MRLDAPLNNRFELFMPVKEGVQQTPKFKFLETHEEITRDVMRNCHGKKLQASTRFP